jgi:hypothetical protein
MNWIRLSTIVLAVSVSVAAVSLGCGSSDATAEGPNCTALQVCCQDFPDAAGSDEYSACVETVAQWSSLPAATGESDCSSALTQYEKEGLCGPKEKEQPKDADTEGG